MALEVYTVGGYHEVGKNMTAVRYNNEIVILDMGVHLPNYITLTEEEAEDVTKLSEDNLRKSEVVPDDTFLLQWKDQVKGIIPSHAHLDHIGAIPYLAKNYNCPIICTPFTAEVIKAICKDEKIKLSNPIKVLNANSKLKVSKNISVEFIHVTHSTPQTVMILVKTPEGNILYANDFKFDNFPVIGSKPNYKRLKELGEEGVKLLIVDSLYADKPSKTPGENIAADMLRDVLLETDSFGKALLVTTFSSHLARLKTIVKMGKKLGRKIVFLGRSMSKYIGAGENIGLVNFSKQGELVKYKRDVRRKLRKIAKVGAHKYMIICTGHQGEPKAVLSRIVNKEMQFKLMQGDHVVFSCNVIPTSINIEAREKLESKLRSYGVRIFKGAHVSGHAAREDLRDLLLMVKPKKIIPSHSEKNVAKEMTGLAKEMGYSEGDILLVGNGRKIVL
ncbi:RNase J family beta-CASP ribonuclease [Candidatus Woesearchaeota archaeon]|nr:RNase J family beta-CASP ribonuclease [Candidatus Woesearchaeota archaeon]